MSSPRLSLSKFRKHVIAEQIHRVADNARLVMLAHWNGTEAFEKARRSWRSNNLHASIVKVRVGRIGLKDTRASFLIPCLRGPTALIYGSPDDSHDRLGQKLLCNAIKPTTDSNNDVLFVAAALDGVMVTRDQAQAIQKASSPDQDLATALSNLPMFSLPRQFRSHIDEIGRIMESHRDRLEQASDADKE